MFFKNDVLIKNIFKNEKEKICKKFNICGWVESFRVQQNNGIAFLTVNDGSGLTFTSHFRSKIG